MGKKLICLAFLFVVLVIAGTVPAASKTWTNTSTDQKWDTPSNWDTGTVPASADVAYIDKGTVGGADECLIGNSITAIAANLYVASADASTGAVYVNGGIMNRYGLTYVGNKGTGTLTISGGTIATKAASKYLYIGGSTTGLTGVGTLNIKNSLVDFNEFATTDLFVGNYGTGSMDVNNSTIKLSRNLFVGNYGTGTATMSNNSVLQLGGLCYIGNQSGGTGSFTISGGTITTRAASKSLYIGGSTTTGLTGIGTMNVTNSYLDFNNFATTDLDVGQYGTGTLNVTGSTLKFSKDLNFGFYGNATVSLTNTLVKANNTGNILRIGDSGTGTLNIDGATILLGTGGIRTGYTGTSSVATINMSSGLIDCPTAASGIRLPNLGTATLNMSGGTFNVSKMALPSEATAISGSIKLTGGVINFTGGGLSMKSQGHIEIGAPGKIVSAGDKLSAYQGYIDDGWITGSHGAPVTLSLAGGSTTMTTGPIDYNIAYSPTPTNNATGVDATVSKLVWAPGNFAKKHDVYFGTVLADVNSATTASTGIYKNRVDSNSFSPISLDYRKTYYWRVDEVNLTLAKVWKGQVWTFTTSDHKVLEDFESYNNIDSNTGVPYDPPYNRYPPATGSIWKKWTDGFAKFAASGYDSYAAGLSGSVIYDSNTIRHGGLKSVKFTYDNDGTVVAPGVEWYPPYYSEMEATPVVANMSSFKSITVYYLGALSNAAQKMYMELSDGTNTAIVYNPDANAVRKELWTAWHISLQAFKDNKPALNLSNITKIIVGIGNRTSPASGGSGTVYFDDIGLYVQTCVSEFITGDLTGNDCIKDLNDVDIMANDWLQSGGGTVYASNPDANHCRVWYKFDETSGHIAEDSSSRYTIANNNDGNVSTDVAWSTSGHSGGCLSCDGTVTVQVPKATTFYDTNTTDVNTQVTVSLWLNGDVNTPLDTRQMAFHGSASVSWTGTPGHVLCLEIPQGSGTMISFESGHIQPQLPGWASFYYGWDTADWLNPPSDAFRGSWNHFAVTKNAETGIARIYHNGLIVAENDEAIRPMYKYLQTFLVGGYALTGSMNYRGKIDDFRIYDYALSQAEVVNLAGKASVNQTVWSIANLNGDNKVDFKDFALLAQNWRTLVLWP